MTRVVDEGATIELIEDMVYLPPKLSVAEYLTHMACSSAAVFTGTVTAVQTFPTEDGTFLFSDYEISVNETFRAASGPASPRRRVTVTRIGGDLSVDGVSASAWVNRFPKLKVGESYLLFVDFLPSGAYYTSVAEGVFQVSGPRFKEFELLNATDWDPAGRGLERERVRKVLAKLPCRSA